MIKSDYQSAADLNFAVNADHADNGEYDDHVDNHDDNDDNNADNDADDDD